MRFARPAEASGTLSALRRLAALVLLLTCCAAAALAASPLDSREFQFRQLLRQLPTTARLMHTTAHPDDEDGAMLTLEARGKGVQTVLMTLTRGEGGQNRMGGALLDSLGALRTLELLAADRYYGVEQRFARVADFGFSKTASETFQKWQGHDIALGDMVRVIRTFRPDVLVSRFRGTERDGHGHHQASGILTREAFKAAADPTRFPEQIKEGLQPWQVKKLYIGNLRSPVSTSPLSPDAYTLELNTGVEDPLLGTSYAQFAMQGLKHQQSQGAGQWSLPPGPRFGYYQLVESVPAARPARELDFFDGIDTALVGLAARMGDDLASFPELPRELQRMQQDAERAAAVPMNEAAAPLLDGYEASAGLLKTLHEPKRNLTPAHRAELQSQLSAKRDQFAQAAALALGLSLQATVERPQTTGGFMAVRGGTFTVAVKANSAPAGLQRGRFALHAPSGWKVTQMEAARWPWPQAHLQVTVSPDAAYSRPCISRKDERQAIYDVLNAACAVLPLPEPVLTASLVYEFAGHRGRLAVPVEVLFQMLDYPPMRRPLAVGPKFSVGASPSTRVVRAGEPAEFSAEVSAAPNLAPRTEFTFDAAAPAGWMTRPTASPTCPRAATDGMAKAIACRFEIATPQYLPDGEYTVTGAAVHAGLRYSEGYTLITRRDLGSTFYYAPATVKVSTVDVKLPAGLKIGYLMGSGDDIPQILTQLGLSLKLIDDAELASGKLEAYDTIVVGIRAYDTRPAVGRYNARLLDYVSRGGTLVVQYNSGTSEFNAGNFTPFPATLGRERVTDEDAPVTRPSPDASLLSYPNRIGPSDFENWVQERGLYFMSSWDSHFQPLLESHDPGEAPLAGGLLEARYGRGTYIYTGLSFFRQLPAGNPGAIRLFVNLIGAGHEPPAAR